VILDSNSLHVVVQEALDKQQVTYQAMAKHQMDSQQVQALVSHRTRK
jgi:hypothetical protein